MLILLLLVPVAVAAALVVSVVLNGQAANLAPMLVRMAAVVPGTCAVFHVARFRSRSNGAMGMTRGLLLLR